MNIYAQRLPLRLCLIVFFIAWLNALLFAIKTANPVIVQDSWYYLDTFLSKAIDGTLTASDFFVRRGGIDHSQPLYKLVFLAELKWFDLDFSIQSVLGLVSAIGMALVLLSTTDIWNETAERQWLNACCVVLIGFSLFSLNSTEIWTWPDVTLQYLGFLFVLIFFRCGCAARAKGSYAAMAVSAAVLSVIASDVALLALVSVIVVFLFMLLRDDNKKRPLTAIIVIASVLVGGQLLSFALTPVSGAALVSDQSRLIAELSNFQWINWIILPLSNSVLASDNIAHLAPNHRHTIEAAIAIFLLLLHVTFWYTFFTRPVTSRNFLSASLMLFSYALVAGIIYGRVPTFGSGYLNSPRYVMYYNFQLIALGVLFTGDFRSNLKGRIPVPQICLTVLVILVIAVQIPVSRLAWASAPYHRLAYNNIAEQIFRMGIDPNVDIQNCAPELPLCSSSPERRARLVGLIKSNRLNIYSRRFQLMHGTPSH